MNSLEKEIIAWFIQNKRDLPWRNTTPWGVMVSEFMLQQTPVVRVLPKWHEWMVTWPTPTDLAHATTAEVITAWGRLGYPRRALRLHESAKIIARDFGGEVPQREEVLRMLPGVGDYTAAAIAAFAYQGRTLVLDVNIRRLFARLIEGVEFPRSAQTKRERTAREMLVPIQGAHTWAAATMELGAVICTSRSPLCDQCPVIAECLWRARGYPKSEVAKKAQTWHGTDRQCRGIIVQALRDNASLTEKEIKKLWHDDFQIVKGLKTLLQDGLIAQVGKVRYSLPYDDV
jgi:A/G-specific adenine glycosylase